jgi:hypothetical protein
MRITITLFLTIISTLTVGELAAKSTPPPVAQGWPRQRTNEQGRLIYYQPQVDAWTNFKDLAFRMAFSLTEAATPDPAALQLKRFPNSVDTLAPNNRFVVAINKVPITPGIPYYTILGDRGRGDSPNSSDGVVPYWSSHLDGARSEFIAPCNHSSPLNPEAIAEVHRILKLNAQSR